MLAEILEMLEDKTPEQLEVLKREVLSATEDVLWTPNPGPQTEARDCLADELFYGGQAGGGKTALLLGLAVTEQRKSLILRRTNKEAGGLVDDLVDIYGSRDGFNGQEGIMRRDGRVIEIGGCQLEDDKQKHKGRARDFYGFDEISDFSESQYIFITGWNRSTTPGQRCRVVAAGNPPTTPEGLWVIKRWAAWLDPTHPKPAKPGELRWYTTGPDGEEIEVDGPGPHDINGEMIVARSRTFIPAELSDNPDLASTNYNSVLAALPEELREAYKEGKFNTALRDKPFQVIPTEWIKLAQERWTPDGYKEFAMTAMAFDPAGGGGDAAELAMRYGGWYAPIITTKGKITADGSAAAAVVITNRKDNCPVVIDMGGGYGGAVTMRLGDNGIPFVAYDGSKSTTAKTIDGKLGFANVRAKTAWRLREALDPSQEGGSVIALPPDPEIVSDLAALTWTLSAKGIQVVSKKDLRKDLGRSTGKGDVIMMALDAGDAAIKRHLSGMGRQPKVILGHSKAKRRR